MTRVPLFTRLPAIHRIKDAEQAPPGGIGPLEAYLSHVEGVLGDVKDSIDALYRDLFIETCADWVIPYIGDLLGTSHLAGDPWTLRADVADTILLRRAKGTLGAIERVAHDLTGWGAHPVELRENLVWAQSLNHQRAGHRFAEIRRPAELSLLGTAYDAFARFPDLSIPRPYHVHHNLPNLAVFLWRLATYRVPHQTMLASPSPAVISTGAAAPAAAWVARFYVDPLARPVRLFGQSTYDPDRRPPVLTPLDQQPAPLLRARIDNAVGPGRPIELHHSVPGTWSYRGENLCAWEAGLPRPLAEMEIAIDPIIGRIAIGAPTQAIAQSFVGELALTFTYGAVGPVGAHPTRRDALPELWFGEPLPAPIVVDGQPGSPDLVDALATLGDLEDTPLVIEIANSDIHELDVNAVIGRIIEDGGPNLACGRPLFLRAAAGQRPIVRLAQPLRLRPLIVSGSDQPAVDAHVAHTVVRFDGITLVAGPGFATDDPLIARAAIHTLELRGCTLDPGGNRVLDGTTGGGRAPARTAMRLREPYGFTLPADEVAFKETPSIQLYQSIAGSLFVDAEGYFLSLSSSIVDAAGGETAIAGGGDPTTTFAAQTVIDGVTIFGRTRVRQIAGRGGIFGGRLTVDDDQTGCLRQCWFSGDGDRLPQHVGCVRAPDARIVFTSQLFGNHAYAQLALESDRRVLEAGPNDDQMGAFGFLREAHKWKNLNIRLRELMPVGVRPLLIPAS